uniref:2og-fe oxygenase n=1 Tax=Moniliophthora roreri TaxID=221103 RepID=A0A0W0FMH3_MONRR
MSEAAQDILNIEAWGSYKVDASALLEEDTVGVPVDSIKVSLADALLPNAASGTPPSHLTQPKKLHAVFKGWREALDNGNLEVPHLLINLLDEEYDTSDVDVLTASSLRGGDRFLLSCIAPMAKAHAFNLHLGEVRYTEVGCPKIVPRDKAEKRELKDNEMDVDLDSEKSFIELEEMDYNYDLEDQRFEIDNITEMDGIPKVIVSPGLESRSYIARDKRQQLIVSGDITDRKAQFEFDFDEYMGFDDARGPCTYPKYDQAATSDSSNALRVEFVKKILDNAAQANDNVVTEWCHSKIESFVENLDSVGVEDVNGIVSWLETRDTPLDSLRDLLVILFSPLVVGKLNQIAFRLIPRLSALQLGDMKVWTALFGALYDGTRVCWDKDALFLVIQSAIQHMADTLEPTATQQVPSFAGLCTRYDSLDALDAFFRRMWDGESQDPEKYAPAYSLNVLVAELDRLAKVDCRVETHLKTTFFGHALERLLSTYSSNNKYGIKRAAKYFDDPTDLLVKHVTPEWLKKLRESDLEDLVDLIRGFLDQAKASDTESVAKLQRLTHLCVDERLANMDYSTLNNPNYNHGAPGLSRVLEKCLEVPESESRSYGKFGLWIALLQLPKFLEGHAISISSAEPSSLSPYVRFADETVKRLLRAGFLDHFCDGKPTLARFCSEATRNPLVSRTVVLEVVKEIIGSTVSGVSLTDLKNVGCGCSDCNQLLVPIFTQKRDVKVGIPLKDRDAVRKHFEERLERKRAWGVTWQARKGKLQITKPESLIALLKQTPNVKQLMKVIDVLGLQQELGAEYAWITPSTDTGPQKRVLDSDGDDDTANKKARLS